jgi:hyperosmotically inducible protein
MKTMLRSTALVLLTFVTLALPSASAVANQERNPGQGSDYLAREVRHQLVMLPYYSIFDDMRFQVNGNSVILSGWVVRPVLKHDAENVVKRVEGVQSVINNIKVLPPSTMDDQLRWALYRSIYGYNGFEKYAMQAVGPIHIIVDSGHVTLTGVVDSQMDKQIADTRAKSIPNVFSVDDQLQVEGNR